MDVHPCGICGVHVLETDEAIQCDGPCSLWHHRECLGMTLDVYLKLSKGHEDWVCRKCTRVKREIKQEVVEAARRQKVSDMGKTKVECKKLDYLTDTQKCVFCGTSEVDEMKYGPVYVHKTIITHYYCLLLSSNMEQNGRDCDGILGFLPNDIAREVKRGLRLNCSYCRSNGATLGCAISKCKVVFHLPCGMKHSTLHQFFGQFKSFCNKHRPVQSISEKILANSSKGAMCGICYDKVVPRPVHETLWAPCCQKSAFFHRDCVQKLAISAGYFFKCPLCNNTTLFQQTMKEFGIYIPEQDASWESVPHAYQDLLVRHDSCDSANCSCPEGRKTNVPGTRWELILCKYCGSQGVHIGCGRLKWKCPQFECDICSSAAAQSNEENSRNGHGNRHRLSGSGRTANIHPSVSADRVGKVTNSDDDSSDSSSSSVVSPKSHVRPKTPPPQKYRKKHHQEKYEIQLQTNTIVVDDDLDEKDSNRFIVIDDSDSDDDVKVVSEEKFSFNQSSSTTLKTVDGMTIPVVQVDSQTVQARKRFRAVGDVEVKPAEIVDITIQMPGPAKKPKVPSPPPVTEVVYTLPKTHSQPSTSQNVPSTSFAPTDFTRFVLVDSSTFRPEELMPGTVLYRSVQPIIQPQAQPPPTNVPMQQQLGTSCHADAEYSDLCKHGTRGSDNFSFHSYSHHLQKSAKKASRRSIKCDSAGRRRGEYSRCDNVRLKNPRVMISRLKSRISPNGHLEFFIPWMDVSSFGPLKRKAMLLYHPMKKMKHILNQYSSKQIIGTASCALPNSSSAEKRQKKNSKRERKKQPQKTFKVKIPFCTKPVITDYYCPSRSKTHKIKIRKTPDHTGNEMNRKNKYNKNGKTISTTISRIVSPESRYKRKQIIEKCIFSPEKKKFKTIEDYLKKTEKLSTSQIDPLNHDCSSNFVEKEEEQLGYICVKSIINNITDKVINTSINHISVSELSVDKSFVSSKIQNAIKHPDNRPFLDLPESSSNTSLVPSDNVIFVEERKSMIKTVLLGMKCEQRISVPKHGACDIKDDNVGIKNLYDKNSPISDSSLDDTLSSSVPKSSSKDSVITSENDNLIGIHDVKENDPNIFKHCDKVSAQHASIPDMSIDGTFSVSQSKDTLTSDDNQPLLSLPESSYNTFMIPLECGISHEDKNDSESAPELEHSFHNVNEKNSNISQPCDIFPSNKNIVPKICELTKSNRNDDVEENCEKDNFEKDMRCLNLNVIDMLNTFSENLEHDLFKASGSHEDSMSNVTDDSQLDLSKKETKKVPLINIHSNVDESTNSYCSVTKTYDEESCTKKFPNKFSANVKIEGNVPTKSCQGFFPKIKFVKNIKTTTKQPNIIDMKTKCSQDRKKALKENISKNQSNKKPYTFLNLEHFFAPIKKVASGNFSIFNALLTTGNDTSKEEKKDVCFPAFSSLATTTQSGSPRKSDQKPLHEIKCNITA